MWVVLSFTGGLTTKGEEPKLMSAYVAGRLRNGRIYTAQISMMQAIIVLCAYLATENMI